MRNGGLASSAPTGARAQPIRRLRNCKSRSWCMHPSFWTSAQVIVRGHREQSGGPERGGSTLVTRAVDQRVRRGTRNAGTSGHTERPRRNRMAIDVDSLLAQARESMTVKRVFGDPIERDELTVIPV